MHHPASREKRKIVLLLTGRKIVLTTGTRYISENHQFVYANLTFLKTVEEKPINCRHISRETGTVATRVPLESAQEVVKL